MVFLGVFWFLVFLYLLMFGIVIVFKDYKIDGKGFLFSIMSSDWVGFENFKFLF